MVAGAAGWAAGRLTTEEARLRGSSREKRLVVVRGVETGAATEAVGTGPRG